MIELIVKQPLLQKRLKRVAKKVCLENSLNLFKLNPYLPRFLRCRFTTRFTKNCNLQGFKEL